MVYYLLIGAGFGVIFTLIGYHMGKKAGILLGMKQFLSIIKVYDDEDHSVMRGINTTLTRVSKMSGNERWMKIEEYVKDNNL